VSYGVLVPAFILLYYTSASLHRPLSTPGLQGADDLRAPYSDNLGAPYFKSDVKSQNGRVAVVQTTHLTKSLSEKNLRSVVSAYLYALYYSGVDTHTGTSPYSSAHLDASRAVCDFLGFLLGCISTPPGPPSLLAQLHYIRGRAHFDDA